MSSLVKTNQLEGNNNANVKVVVRIRPLNDAERNGRYGNVAEAISDHMLVFDPKVQQVEGFLQTQRRGITGRRVKDLKYAFDHVLRSSAKNKDVFEKATQKIVESVLSGYNCSVFAYGATGSGKTHTMLGNDHEPGVIYHTMLELYKHIDALKDEKVFCVAVSYLEIYNETVRDLLNPNTNLPIREDKAAGVMIAGLSLHKPDSAEDLLHMLQYGNKNRSQHPTDANAESSRSHAVFQVHVKMRPKLLSGTDDVHVAKICLVDLAGSERAIHNRNEGARFREGANINRSLLALGNVINALAAKTKGHIPYRDSKLTRLLKDSLGGNCQTVMIATVSPSSRSYDDTYNTLRYADRAKHIKADLMKNVMSVDQHIVNYKRYVADLERENHDLREKTKLLQASVKGQEIVPAVMSPVRTVKQFQERLHELFKYRKELMRSQITAEVVKRELKWKLSRKERAIKRVERLSGLKDVVIKHHRVVDRINRRYHKEEMNLQKTTQKLREQDDLIYGLNAELVNRGNVDKNYKELMTMSFRFYVTESYLHDTDMHLCFVKKMARAEERQSVVNERLILDLIHLVKKQQAVLKSHNVCSEDLEKEYKECCYLVEERGVAWVQQHVSKTGAEPGEQNNSSFLNKVEEKEDLSISEVIDIPLPKIDLNILKLGSLSPCSSKGSQPTTTQKPMLMASNIGRDQFRAPQRVVKKSPLQQTTVTAIESPVYGKPSPFRLSSTKSLNSAINKLPQQTQPAKRKLLVSPQKVGEGTKNVTHIEAGEGGNVKKMVEKYSSGFSLNSLSMDLLRKQSPFTQADNLPRSKITARKSLLQSPQLDRMSTPTPKQLSLSGERHTLIVPPKSSPPDDKDDPPSDKLNHTFEVDKPAIPNTPCIDSLVSRNRRMSCNSSTKDSTPLLTNSSPSYSSRHKSRQLSLSSDKNLTRCKLNFSNAYSANFVLKCQGVPKDKTLNVSYKNINSLMDLPVVQQSEIVGNTTSNPNPGSYESLLAKCHLSKDRVKPSATSRLRVSSQSPMGPKESPSLSRCEQMKEWGAKSRAVKLWRSQSAQHLGNNDNNTSNNCATDTWNDEEGISLCSSTPENIFVGQVSRSSTPKMEVIVCSPISNTDTDGSTEQKHEGKREVMRTPEFKMDPYMHTVIQSLKKHGIPSLTERLSLAQGSGLQLQAKDGPPPTLQGSKGLRERSPLRALDVNSSKYQRNRLGNNKPSPPEMSKAEQVTMIQLPQTTHSNALGLPSVQNRLEKLKERRHQRQHAAKPYSRGTILANRGQRLAAALRKPSKATDLIHMQGITSSSAATNTTGTTKPSYMLSTFAASQKASGPEKEKSKVSSSFFSQGLQQRERRPVTGLRNKSSVLPWLNFS